MARIFQGSRIKDLEHYISIGRRTNEAEARHDEVAESGKIKT
jgi:hypothetical protein